MSSRPLRRILLLAFPALVWFVGCFFLLGDTGKWLDDYAAHVRDPVSGSFEWSDLCRYHWWFFWRPIHVQLVFVLQTLLWNHNWLNHLFSAAMHALACLSLWHFLRECGLRPLVCACAAVVTLASAQSIEAIFWPATVSTTIAAASYFFACRIVVRFAQGRHKRGAVPVLGLLGLAIPCLYEQPAAALAALPILYAAAAMGGWRSSIRPAPTPLGHLKRCVLGLIPCALGVLAYLAAFVITVKRDEMTRESRFANPEQLWPRAQYTGRVLGYMLDPTRGLDELTNTGLGRLGMSGPGVIGWGLLLALFAGAWAVIWLWTPDEQEEPSAESNTIIRPRANAPLLLVFGLLAIGLALLPIVAISGAGLSARLTYFPLACAAAAGALLIDRILGFVARLRLFAVSVRAVVLFLTLVYTAHGIVSQVGIQSLYQRRHAADMNQLRKLHDLVPNPEPDTIFVPLHCSFDPLDPEADKVRSAFQPIWASAWAINTMIKHEYRRRDVHACCIYLHNQSTAIIRMGDPTMVSWSHFSWNLPTPRLENYCPRFTLGQMVPFAIDAEGRVTLVDAVTVGNIDGGARTFEFPQVLAAKSRGASVQQRTLALPLNLGGEWILGWRWPNRENAETKFLRLANWGASERAVRMHPPTPGVKIDGDGTDEMTTLLAPSTATRRLVFHATLAEETIDLSILGDGVEVRWSLDDGPPLASVFLDPKAVKAQQAWTRVEVNVPPAARERLLRVRVGAGPKGNHSCDRVVVTSGIELGTSDAMPLGIPSK